MSMLLCNVVLTRDSRPMDLRVRGNAVVEVGAALRPAPQEQLIDARGSRLVPALHDDHLHIGAWLRAMRSQTHPLHGLDAHACAVMQRQGPGASGWSVLFGIDHHHLLSVELALLDAQVSHPVLLVHRTGHAAFANQRGRQRLEQLGLSLRNVSDCWRACVGHAPVAEETALLHRLREMLLAAGVTAVRDATPCPSSMGNRARRIADVLAPVRVSFMGLPDDPLHEATHLKMFDVLAPVRTERPLAFHAVEPSDIHGACGRVDARGRIEHASICPEPLVEVIASTRCSVCANPAFMEERSAALQPMLASGEAEFYQPLRQFIDAGIRVSFGSDAPVAAPGPWAGIRGAVQRCSAGTHFPGERLTIDEALRCAVQIPRLVDACAADWLGQRADMALLDPAEDAPMDASQVRATIAAGRLCHFNLEGVQSSV